MADNNIQTTKQNTQAAAESARQQGADTARQAAQAVQQSGQAAGDAFRRTGESAAETAQRGTEAGAGAAQRGAELATEALTRGSEAFADSQRQFVQKAAEQFEELSRKVAQAAQGTTENVRALMALPTAANGGLQDMRQSMTGLIEGVVRTNLRATQELYQLTNPSALLELQQRFVREYLDTLMEGTATIVRATRRTADETLRPLERQIEQRRADQHQGYRHAAE